tara:strand:+ start:508 stop:1152 length:645 start_codon:yes stop_codon:yes gene_type:complete
MGAFAAYAAAAQLVITIASISKQQEAQRAQIANANKIAQENARLANESYKNSMAQIAEKNRALKAAENQQLEQAGNLALEQQVEALKATGTAITASGEAGVEGISPGMQISDLERQSINNLNAINRNLDTSLGNIGRQRKNLTFSADSAYYSALNQVNSMQMQRGLDPSASALQFASGALDAGTTYYKLGGRVGDNPNTQKQESWYNLYQKPEV